MDIQEKQFQEMYLTLGGKQVELESENGEYTHSKSQMAWGIWQAAKAQTDQKIKSLLCDEHLKKCESPTGVFNSQYPDEEPCLICLAKQAKTQAVPEWIDYTKQSPRIDGRYQIFISGEQITADWQSPFGFSDPVEGEALIQDLISHWGMLPEPPKPQEPAND